MISETDLRIMEDKIIENDMSKIQSIPSNLKSQLGRMQKLVFKIWSTPYVHTGKVKVQMFQLVVNSKITLNQLEYHLINTGNDYAGMKFERALKKMVKQIENQNRRDSSYSRKWYSELLQRYRS